EFLRPLANECEAILVDTGHLRSTLLHLQAHPRLLLLGSLYHSPVAPRPPRRAFSASERGVVHLGYTPSVLPKLASQYLVDLLVALHEAGTSVKLHVLATAGTAARMHYSREKR